MISFGFEIQNVLDLLNTLSVEVRASLPPVTKNVKLFQTANMAATMAAVTRPPDLQNSRKLLISPSRLDVNATRASAQGIHKTVFRRSIQNAVSVLLHPSTGPVTAKKLADRSDTDVRSAATA